MLPTGSCTVAVWPAATPLKLGVVTRFLMSRLPRKAELRRGEQAIRAAERVQNEAGDDHPDDDGDGRHGDLFDVHGKGAPSRGTRRLNDAAGGADAARDRGERATRKSVS